MYPKRVPDIEAANSHDEATRSPVYVRVTHPNPEESRGTRGIASRR
jgi:hypothetical protein